VEAGLTHFKSRALAAASKFVAAAIILLVTVSRVHADGSAVDKVYHPYVDALESEIEFRSIFQDSETVNSNLKELHQLSFGRSLGQSLFGEAYLVGRKSATGNFDIEFFEFELKWQLTEQGEYSADWGVLFEYEQEFGGDIHEFTAALLVEKEFGRWSGTANLHFIQEWGGNIKDEFETALALQARYRYAREFEPALELYAGQNSTGLGPVIMGNASLGIRKSIHWEAGVIFGLDKKSPNNTYRFLLEFEF
tara:strand:+ start:2891 stop:3643 length:753 start_codon:yes stop_codon:yes gene_type:complete